MKKTSRSKAKASPDIIGRQPSAVGEGGGFTRTRATGAGYFNHNLEIRQAATQALNRLQRQPAR